MQWAPQLHNVLTLLETWDIVARTKLFPVGAAGITIDNQQKWEMKDQSAMAMIAIFTTSDMQSCQTLIYDTTHTSLAETLWDTLRTLYASLGITGNFYIFCKASWLQIHEGSNLSKGLNKLNARFNQLMAGDILLPDNLKAMMIFQALPPSFDTVISTLIHSMVITDFTPNKILSKIMSKTYLCNTQSLASHVHTHEVQADAVHISVVHCCYDQVTNNLYIEN